MKRVAIVGLGNVGTAYLNALITEDNLVNEIVLIDIDKDKLNGEYLDVKDSLAVINSSINIILGSYSDVKDCDILVICAGRNQKEGETRLDLLNDTFNNIVESDTISAEENLRTLDNNSKDFNIHLAFDVIGDFFNYAANKCKDNKHIIGFNDKYLDDYLFVDYTEGNAK